MPYEVKFWAHRGNETMTDADPAALLKFARTADSVHEYNADMPPESAETLPAERRVACTAKSSAGFPTSAQLGCSGPQQVTVAITREQYARLVGMMEQSCQVAQAEQFDPRYFGQQLRPPQARTGPTPEEAELFRRYLFAAVQSGKVTSQPMMSNEATAGAIEAIKQLPPVQAATGVASGFVVSFVPLGGPISDAAISTGIIDPGSRLQCGGKALGEIIGGITQIAVGCGGIGIGTGTTSTGGGAPLGIWLTSESTLVAANGAVTTATGLGSLWHVMFNWREDVLPAAPEVSVPAPKPAPAPKPNEPTQAPKTAAEPAPAAKTNEAKPSTQAKPAPTNTPASQQPAGQPPYIRNKHLAGQKHPKTGVPFDQDGYPDFRAAGVVKAEVKIKFTGDPKKDYAAAYKAANIKGPVQGYSWHHHQDGTTMQLVPTPIHRATGHTGGMAHSRKQP